MGILSIVYLVTVTELNPTGTIDGPVVGSYSEESRARLQFNRLVGRYLNAGYQPVEHLINVQRPAYFIIEQHKMKTRNNVIDISLTKWEVTKEPS